VSVWSRHRWVVVGSVVVGSAVVLLAAGALIVVLWPRHAGMADSSVVYCLSADRRPQLRDAAVALGMGSPAPSSATDLVVGDRPVDLDRWRGQHPRDFEKACTALMAAVRGPGQPGGGGDTSSLLASVVPLVAAVAGALLTWRATARRDAGGLLRQQAEALRSANLRFVQAAERYLRRRLEPGDPPSPDELRERRSDLAAQVDQVAASHPAWTLPREVRQRLSTELADDLVGKPGPVTRALVDDRLAKLRDLSGSVERLALAHSRPGRRHLDMRTAITVGNDHAG
jgi:hypothetical protein